MLMDEIKKSTSKSLKSKTNKIKRTMTPKLIQTNFMDTFDFFKG
jgi:hypothetical protein